MLDGHHPRLGRVNVTITAIPPFTSVSHIACLVQSAVDHYGQGRPGRPPSIDESELAPVTDVNDGSAGGLTELIVTGRSGTSHADVRRFLDRIPTVHQRVQVELERPLATLVREAAAEPSDLGSRLELIEHAIAS